MMPSSVVPDRKGSHFSPLLLKFCLYYSYYEQQKELIFIPAKGTLSYSLVNSTYSNMVVCKALVYQTAVHPTPSSPECCEGPSLCRRWRRTFLPPAGLLVFQTLQCLERSPCQVRADCCGNLQLGVHRMGQRKASSTDLSGPVLYIPLCNWRRDPCLQA